ncbi:MAG: hypothetical protein HZC01_04900 [Candidatus Kerfeldbacteria bacterium]|nr:hypothetical protein [Candidatus Kerfeldbacteria bacterium]
MKKSSKQALSGILLLIAVVVIGAVVYSRLGTNENSWVCENGAWVKRGNPTAAAPTTGCSNTNTTANSNGGVGGPEITTYDECVDAGYAIMESYPPRCAVPGGQTFTQDIGNELEKADEIVVDSPRPQTKITSPLKITGRARGSWFFESEFPVTLMDSDGAVIVSGTASAEGDAMTTEFVDFTLTLTFDKPEGNAGTLILSKNNPSGLPELNDELSIPLIFD